MTKRGRQSKAAKAAAAARKSKSKSPEKGLRHTRRSQSPLVPAASPPPSATDAEGEDEEHFEDAEQPEEVDDHHEDAKEPPAKKRKTQHKTETDEEKIGEGNQVEGGEEQPELPSRKSVEPAQEELPQPKSEDDEKPHFFLKQESLESLDSLESLGDPPVVSESPIDEDDVPPRIITWTPEMDVVLFQALAKYRPVGVHKHFRMVNLMRYFNRNSPTPADAATVWEHLKTYWNVDILDSIADESDDDVPLEARRKRPSYPFKIQCEFTLPPEDFEAIMAEHRKAPGSPPSATSPDVPTIEELKEDEESEEEAKEEAPKEKEVPVKEKAKGKEVKGRRKSAVGKEKTVKEKGAAKEEATTKRTGGRGRPRAASPAVPDTSRSTPEEEAEEPKAPGRKGRGRKKAADKKAKDKEEETEEEQPPEPPPAATRGSARRTRSSSTFISPRETKRRKK